MDISNTYWAGLFDAEGSLGIDKTLHLQVRLGNTNKKVMDLLNTAYPGTLYYSDKSKLPYWIWTCKSVDTELFLMNIKPYTIIKRSQVKLCLEFLNYFKGTFQHKTTKDVLLKRFSYKVKLESLRVNNETLNYKNPLDNNGPAYYAGLLDGDGSISIDRNSPTASIAGASEEVKLLAEKLIKTYGGSLEVSSIFYRWNIYGKNALLFIEAILPFLIIKKEKAAALLACYKAEPMIGSGNRYEK